MPVICDRCKKNVSGLAVYNVPQTDTELFTHLCPMCYYEAQKDLHQNTGLSCDSSQTEPAPESCSYCARPVRSFELLFVKLDDGRNVPACGACYDKYKPKDPINPSHYRDHPSGVECITITQHENFCIGNAIKYLWRRRKKDVNKEVEDLKKAVWYIQQEIVRLTDGGQQMSKAQSVGKQYEPTHNLGIPYAPEDPANPKSLV